MSMATIHLGQRRLSDYATAVAPEALAALRRLAEPLAGLRVLHLSAGPFGSATAETLAALVPLQRDLGLLADWQWLRGDAPRVWSALYEGLSGTSVHWGRKERAAWHAAAERHAAAIAPGYDVVVAHDPQAVALAQALPAAAGRPRWVWHCHLDIRRAQGDVWADVRRAIQPYAAALFPAPELVPRDIHIPYRGVARPALDPVAPRNLPLPSEAIAALLGRLGVDPNRPLIGQFSPIDQRYAPMAALGTYWIARRDIPDLQIVLVDPSLVPSERARRDLEQVAQAAAGDPDIHLLTPHAGLGPTELNALERAVAVVLQLAVPCGFGWGLAECQWKGKPAIVGRHGQLPEQVGEGASGLVAEGAPDAAAAVVRLLRDPILAQEIGRRGHEWVARDYLITGLVGDHLRLFRRITASPLTAPRRW
ncbi:MAG: hypothetical protein HY689_16530 [Chloroflexi bacterium]|nr:hypothetical protein [Chloroflexota bacterium]